MDTSVKISDIKLKIQNLSIRLLWYGLFLCCSGVTKYKTRQSLNFAATKRTCENKHNCNFLNNVSVYSEAKFWIRDDNSSPFRMTSNRSK